MQNAKLLTWLAVLAWPLLVGGCNENKPLFQAKSESYEPPAATAANNEQYTILLYVASGPSGHRQQALEYKNNTEELTNWRGLYIVHEPGHSELYWGKYATAQDAAKNLKKAKQFRTPTGVAVYAKAIIMPLPGQDIGPAKWNLLNADGRYTVVIAVFFDVPEEDYFGRREFAVQYCRQLREKGEKAFFHHGISVSRVTVETFDESAIGVVDSKRQIQSSQMKAVLDRYPYLAVNGRKEIRKIYRPKEKIVETVPQRSYPVVIPSKEERSPADAIDSSGYPQSW